MSEFSFRNYDTSYRYACKLKSAKDKIAEKDFKIQDHAACFSTFFSDCGGERHIVIEIHSGIGYLNTTHKDNACFFCKADMEKHINEAKKLFDFDFSISRKKKLSDGYWGYEIDIDIDLPEIYEKYIVTWVRYLYEFPFNTSLFDVYKLHDLPEFKDMTVENLMLVVLNCHIIGDGWVRGIHSIPRPRKGDLFTTEQLKKKLKSLEKTHDRYNHLNKIYPSDFVCTSLTDDIKYGDPYSLSRWLDKKMFKKRIEVYKKVIEDNTNKKGDQ